MRKCGFCNGAGHFYPIDEGPLQECRICNGSGLVSVKVLRKRTEGRGSPRGAKVEPSTDASFGRVRVRQNG
jgi:DnaJ-class molecular chaperone